MLSAVEASRTNVTVLNMKTYINPNTSEWSLLLKRPTKTIDDIESIVMNVFNSVKSEGDKAIKLYTTEFDKADLDTIIVSESEISEASKRVSKDLKTSIYKTYRINEYFFFYFFTQFWIF